MTNPTNTRVTLICLTCLLLYACGDTASPNANDVSPQPSDAADVAYPDEPWDPGEAPWEDCMDGYGDECNDGYGSGSTTYGEAALCTNGYWDAQANDGEGVCICDEGYTSENCSDCDTGFTMTANGCVSE